MKKIFKKIKLPLIFAAIFLSANSVFAQASEWSLQVNWPDSPLGNGLTAESGIAHLVRYFYEWGIAAGIIIFFGILIYAGFLYITSAGNPKKLNSAKEKIISGFSGVILLLGSYLILNTINPELTSIKTIELKDEPVGTQSFQSGLNNEENLCEMANITIQDKEESTEQVRFMIPGMNSTEEDFFPIKSTACKPKRNIKEILEVRKNKVDGYYTLVKKYSGEEVIDEDERVDYLDDEGNELNNYTEDLQDLYGQRYVEGDSLDISDEDEIHGYLLKARTQKTYNIFGREEDSCETIIKQENFNRARCLIYKDDRTLKEWYKEGYPSLVEALREVQDKGEGNIAEATYPNHECPTGYVKATTGAGCKIAFYDGEEGGVPYVGWGSSPSCKGQISKPSATMDHFDGIVDREANCMELARHEPPVDLDLPEYTLTIKNKLPDNLSANTLVEVFQNGTKIGEIEENSSKEFEVDAYTNIEINSSYQYSGLGGSRISKCLQLYLQEDDQKCGTATSGQASSNITLNCSYQITNKNTIIFESKEWGWDNENNQKTCEY